MKKKISVLIITMLLCVSTVLVVKKDFEVEASPGGDGGGGNGDIGLDYSYIWNITENLSYVIYNAYEEGDIPKGRAFGSKGGNYTIKEILKPQMEAMNLTDVHTEQIKHIPDPDIKKNYTSIISMTDFNLKINNCSCKTYPWPNPVPKKEMFVIASGYPLHDFTSLTHNYSFNNALIIQNNFTKFTELWPLAGTYNNYTFNVTNYDNLSDITSVIVGNVTYIAPGETVPSSDNQYGRVYLMADDEDCQDKLDNITTAEASIIIKNATREDYSVDSSKCPSSVVGVSNSDGNSIKEILENYTTVLVDNVAGNLTISPINGKGWWPTADFVFIDRIPDHYELANITWCEGPLIKFIAKRFNKRDKPTFRDYHTCVYAKSLAWREIGNNRWVNCSGIILYDSYEYHFMVCTLNFWDKDPIYPPGLFDKYKLKIKYGPAIPVFTLNYSVGNWLNKNRSSTTLDGYANQTLLEETTTSPGLEAYNVVGNITIEESPDDAIAIISNRYDGMWGQTPGDSGVGGAIVLGIAKYMKEYNIKPKYNLTFLFTTGEEWGFRGAWHYNDSHQYNDTPPKKNNIKYWFILDQLAFNQADQPTWIYYNNNAYGDVLNETFKNQTRYWKRTGYENKTYLGIGGGSEQGVASSRPNCNSFCFVKGVNYTWDRWHRAGMTYTEGDSLNYIDRMDVNVTAELVWNVTKYFLVNPDCWFESHSFNTSDSDDVDNLKDTVTVGFDVKSILPDDLDMVKCTLKRMFAPLSPSVSKYMNFSVNRSITSKSISITLPENEPAGFYRITICLYNSTGRINKNVGLSGYHFNQTKYYLFIYLHPNNYSNTPPEIIDVTDSPDPVGYGFNVTISADVTSNVTSIDMVTVNISYPDDTLKSFNMSNTGGDTYEYVFNDTWQYGQYDYAIWAKDSYGIENGSSQYSFNVSVNASISVCTVKDSYGDNETVNLTDPPGDIGSLQQIGYELLDDGEVLRIWNKLDNYYFNTSNGIQFTNHYNKYWSHNVLMLRYYNNDVWNLIYRTDELSGFNKDIESDNETFVNATLWKDLTYQGYDFRLAIRYHLGFDDNELAVIPHIKNIDDEDIPYVLGFAWEIKDIQIGMTTVGDYIEINGTTYFLNEEDLDETFKNMDMPCFYIREDLGGDESESLYLRWDENLNYVVRVKSQDDQYNAPVTLGIKIGTLDVGQEKYTSLFWHDAFEKVFYFDDYEMGGSNEWAVNPGFMVDGNISTYAETATNYDLERCNNNTCNGTDLGAITKVEIRCRGYHDELQSQADIILRPIFFGNDGKPGDDHTFVTPPVLGGWSQWFDITNDTNAPGPLGWEWHLVKDLFCDVIAKDPQGPPYFTLFCSKVEVRVTYNVGPVVSDPYPANGSTGVSIAPVLSVYVYDADNDLMNISWLSNSSGSWQAFGGNSSVQTGTYYQTMDNASVNGDWWYWMVNVSDVANYTLSDVFKFYTGNKSMIENTGSTNFSGYLLMQVRFYNTSLGEWVVEQVVVNDSSPRVVNVGGVLGLDTIFNAHCVNTSGFQNGDGTYCVYAVFCDPDGNALYVEGAGSSMGGGGYLIALYVFTVSAG